MPFLHKKKIEEKAYLIIDKFVHKDNHVARLITKGQLPDLKPPFDEKPFRIRFLWVCCLLFYC